MDLRGYEFKSEFARKYVAMGREEGFKEGFEETRREVFRDVLRRLVEQRFGALSSGDRKRIEEANADDLLRWLDRVIHAKTVAAVFAAAELG